MTETHAFRFVDDRLNRKLIDLLEEKARDKVTVDADGTVRYSHRHEDLIGNDLICSVRCTVFSAWQIISFPAEWADSYMRYMKEHDVPFREEIRNGNLWFLIPRSYRPHSWKLVAPRTAHVG